MMAMGRPMTIEESAIQVNNSLLTQRPEDVLVVLVAAELLTGSHPCSRSLDLGLTLVLTDDVPGITLFEVGTKGEQRDKEWRPLAAMLRSLWSWATGARGGAIIPHDHTERPVGFFCKETEKQTVSDSI